MRIVFMGTPDFAVASLAALVESGEQVVGVITAPDKPAGRGQKLQQSAVKKYALGQKIPVLQPEKLKNPDFLAQLAAWKADLQVVVAFRMLPEVVWNMPIHGTVNLHASLLPQYRGAAPINHAIINGEEESGVTTFLLQHEIDTGHILFSEKVPIGPQDTAGDLHDKLMETGATLLIKTVGAIKHHEVIPQPQEMLATDIELRHAPKIFKADCEINWEQSAQHVYNFIRGLSPYPTAYTKLDGKTLKIFKATKLSDTRSATSGTYRSDGRTFLDFACTDGYIRVDEVQIEGKRRMITTEFLRGYRVAVDS